MVANAGLSLSESVGKVCREGKGSLWGGIVKSSRRKKDEHTADRKFPLCSKLLLAATRRRRPFYLCIVTWREKNHSRGECYMKSAN